MCTEDITLVPLTAHGIVVGHVIVDTVDVPFVTQWHWYINAQGYAARTATKADHSRSNQVMLHRELMGLSRGDNIEVDHINRNRLDCRRSNMRQIYKRKNPQNVSSRQGSTSRYRGVSWDAGKKKWLAQAYYEGRQHFLGRFSSEEEAAEVAQQARLHHMSHTID